MWSVPVIDLNALSGLNPMVDEQLPLFRDPSYDRLHPNTKGHERIARTLYYQLLALPCLFLGDVWLAKKRGARWTLAPLLTAIFRIIDAPDEAGR